MGADSIGTAFFEAALLETALLGAALNKVFRSLSSLP